MSGIFVVTVEAEGGGTDRILIVAEDVEGARAYFSSVLSAEEFTVSFLFDEYGGSAVLGML